MATIVTRAGKGSPLTNNEVDANFNNLNTAVIASANYTGSGTGAATITVQSKLNQVVNVKDYGATGDGTTNDTTAIQNAINASGGIIYFPAGTYSVTALTLATGKQLTGENRETSILKLRSAMTIGNGLINGTSLTGIAIRNLTLDGNLIASAAVALINLFACDGAIIESNNFTNTDRFAVGCNSMSRWVARDNRFIMPQHVGVWIGGIPAPSGGTTPTGTTYNGTVSAPTGSNPIQAAFTYRLNASNQIIPSYVIFSHNGAGYLTVPTVTFPAATSPVFTAHIGGSQVVAITASNSSTTGENVEISHNYFEGGGTNLALQRSAIFGNVGCNIIYGATFVEHADNNTGQNRFYNNTSWYGGYCTLSGATYSNTFIGPDTDNTVTTGFELWGILTSAENNYAYYNAGVGISFGCRNGLCSNNTAYDNGQYWASIGNYNTYGIQLPQGNAGSGGFNHGSFAVVQGNRCFDQNGASGKQAYGIGIEGPLVVSAKIVDNDASGNRTSDYNMNGATPSVLRDILSSGGGSSTVTPTTINGVVGVSTSFADAYSNRKVVEARDYGLVTGSSGAASSNSTIVNNLMAGLSARGGGILQLPPGDIYIASTLDNKYPRVQVWGAGAENFHDSGSPTFGTRLIATIATTMLKLRTPYAAEQGVAASSTWKYTGGGFKYLALNGGAVATKALLIDSVSFVDVDVFATNFNSTEFYTIQCGISATNLGEACDVQFSKIVLRARAIDTVADKAATICRLLGSSNANVSLNRLPENGISVYAQHWNGNVLTADSADNNDISLVGVRAGGTGYLAYMKGPTASIPVGADSNTIYYATGGGSIFAEGTNTGGVTAGIKNRITHLDVGNGTPAPTAGTGSSWAYTRGLDNTIVGQPSGSLGFSETVADASATQLAITSETLRVRNTSSNHVRLTDTVNEWGVNIDGANGNLRFNRVAGTGTVSFGGIALPAASGGTGLTSPGTTGNVLTSNGTGWVSSAPSGGGGGVTSFSGGSTGLLPNTASTGAIALSGTLIPSNGGTGLTSPGTSGNVLTSNGTGWVSSAPTGGSGLWSTWSSTVSAQTGTFTSTTVIYARYTAQGKTITFQFAVLINTVGTASGSINFTLPIATTATAVGYGVDLNSRSSLSCIAVGSTTTMNILTYNGANAITAANYYIVSGTYESV